MNITINLHKVAVCTKCKSNLSKVAATTTKEIELAVAFLRGTASQKATAEVSTNSQSPIHTINCTNATADDAAVILLFTVTRSSDTVGNNHVDQWVLYHHDLLRFIRRHAADFPFGDGALVVHAGMLHFENGLLKRPNEAEYQGKFTTVDKACALIQAQRRRSSRLEVLLACTTPENIPSALFTEMVETYSRVMPGEDVISKDKIHIAMQGLDLRDAAVDKLFSVTTLADLCQVVEHGGPCFRLLTNVDVKVRSKR